MPKTTDAVIAEIRRLRTAGVSRSETAKALGVSRQTVSKHDFGNTCSTCGGICCVGFRRCASCQKANRRAKDRERRKRQVRCPVKSRNRRLLNQYGLGSAGYTALLVRQKFVCAICGSYPDAGSNLNVDHDHESGDVRGLLCSSCNSGLGDFNDDIGILKAAAAYLVRSDEPRLLPYMLSPPHKPGWKPLTTTTQEKAAIRKRLKNKYKKEVPGNFLPHYEVSYYDTR